MEIREIRGKKDKIPGTQNTKPKLQTLNKTFHFFSALYSTTAGCNVILPVPSLI
jgi:hypothetical protein